jgi:hypothetical protein
MNKASAPGHARKFARNGRRGHLARLRTTQAALRIGQTRTGAGGGGGTPKRDGFQWKPTFDFWKPRTPKALCLLAFKVSTVVTTLVTTGHAGTTGNHSERPVLLLTKSAPLVNFRSISGISRLTRWLTSVLACSLLTGISLLTRPLLTNGATRNRPKPWIPAWISERYRLCICERMTRCTALPRFETEAVWSSAYGA